ncbi:hypothetical protein PINS_up020585 [Pythium insidiosum]|nr:hypothetical protein PINS_up020585 [Pythium insidiosum]
MLCRLTKFGWFDDEQHREIVDEVTKFLQATVDHCIIGLQILNELVTEMNLPVAGRNITFHRKIAVSFREEALFRIFQVSLTTLRQLQMHNIGGATADQEQRLGDHALSLAIKALSFDFIGTNPDESADEVGSLQVPTSWRQVIQDPQTMQLLFDYYSSNSPPNTAQVPGDAYALCVCASEPLRDRQRPRRISDAASIGDLHNLDGTARTLRPTELPRILPITRATQVKLSAFGAHEGRVVSGLDEYDARVTVKSLQQWQWSANSTHYLLGLWARLVAALPYVPLDARTGMASPATFLDNGVPQVIQAYVMSRLESSEQCAADDTLDNPLNRRRRTAGTTREAAYALSFQLPEHGRIPHVDFRPRAQSVCGVVRDRRTKWWWYERR